MSHPDQDRKEKIPEPSSRPLKEDEDHLSTILQNYVRRFSHGATSPITKALLYLFSTSSDLEASVFSLTDRIEIHASSLLEQSPPSSLRSHLEVLAVATVFMYTSVRMGQDLSHMRDKYTYKGRPCIHVVFGEVVTQLASISLSGMAVEMVNNLIDDPDLRVSLLEELHSQMSETSDDDVASLLGVQDRNIMKQKLSEQLQKVEADIFKKLLTVCWMDIGTLCGFSSKKVKNLIQDGIKNLY